MAKKPVDANLGVQSRLLIYFDPTDVAKYADITNGSDFFTTLGENFTIIPVSNPSLNDSANTADGTTTGAGEFSVNVRTTRTVELTYDMFNSYVESTVGGGYDTPAEFVTKVQNAYRNKQKVIAIWIDRNTGSMDDPAGPEAMAIYGQFMQRNKTSDVAGLQTLALSLQPAVLQFDDGTTQEAVLEGSFRPNVTSGFVGTSGKPNNIAANHVIAEQEAKAAKK